MVTFLQSFCFNTLDARCSRRSLSVSGLGALSLVSEPDAFCVGRTESAGPDAESAGAGHGERADTESAGARHRERRQSAGARHRERRGATQRARKRRANTAPARRCLRRGAGGLYVGPQRSLCRVPALALSRCRPAPLSVSGSCVGRQLSLCRRALCVRPWHSVRRGTRSLCALSTRCVICVAAWRFCVGSRRPGTLCVRAQQSVCRARRSYPAPRHSVSGPRRLCVDVCVGP